MRKKIRLVVIKGDWISAACQASTNVSPGEQAASNKHVKPIDARSRQKSLAISAKTCFRLKHNMNTN